MCLIGPKSSFENQLEKQKSFKFDQLELSGIRECREVGDSENRACEISLARLSPRLLRRRESKRHLFVVDSLDKQMQNKKKLIRLRCNASAKGGGGLFVFVWR